MTQPVASCDKGRFYRHVLLATDQPDAALAYRGEEKKLKGEVEC